MVYDEGSVEINASLSKDVYASEGSNYLDNAAAFIHGVFIQFYQL